MWVLWLKKIVASIWPTFFWTCFMLYAFLKAPDLGDNWLANIPHFDKVIHLGLFAVWSFLFLSFLVASRFFVTPKAIFWAVTIAVFWAALSEILQGLLTTTRTPDVLDALADTVGATLGVGFFFLIRHYWQAQVSNHS